MSSPSPSPSPTGKGVCADQDHLYAYIAIPVVLVLSILGTASPAVLAKIFPHYPFQDSLIFRFCHGMAGGFIVSVALVHSFPDAVETFQETSLPEYAWAGLFALIGLLSTWTCEIAIRLVLAHRGANLSHSHGQIGKKPEELARIERENREKIQREEGHCDHNLEEVAEVIKEGSYVSLSTIFVLVFGLIFHSVFVGFAIGLENDRELFIATLCHQLFEGLAIGLHLLHHPLSWTAITFIVCIFSFSTPVGTGIGIGVSVIICKDPETFNIVSGIFNGLASGILVYVACVHMISEEFAKPDVQRSPRNAFLLWLGVIFGASAMAVLGIWA